MKKCLPLFPEKPSESKGLGLGVHLWAKRVLEFSNWFRLVRRYLETPAGGMDLGF